MTTGTRSSQGFIRPPALPRFPLLRAMGVATVLEVGALGIRSLQPQVATLVDLSQPIILGFAGALYVVWARSRTVLSAVQGGAIAALLPTVLALIPVVEEILAGSPSPLPALVLGLLRGVISGICGSLLGYLLAQRVRV